MFRLRELRVGEETSEQQRYVMEKETEQQRKEILTQLSRTKFISHREPEFFHGQEDYLVWDKVYICTSVRPVLPVTITIVTINESAMAT